MGLARRVALSLSPLLPVFSVESDLVVIELQVVLVDGRLSWF